MEGFCSSLPAAERSEGEDRGKVLISVSQAEENKFPSSICRFFYFRFQSLKFSYILVLLYPALAEHGCREDKKMEKETGGDTENTF